MFLERLVLTSAVFLDVFSFVVPVIMGSIRTKARARKIGLGRQLGVHRENGDNNEKVVENNGNQK